MTRLAVRRLLIDLESDVPRHWCGGDPFRTAFFDALSMSFPVGEQFFIDAVRNGHSRTRTPTRSLPRLRRRLAVATAICPVEAGNVGESPAQCNA